MQVRQPLPSVMATQPCSVCDIAAVKAGPRTRTCMSMKC
jgi:hypothetical protein